MVKAYLSLLENVAERARFSLLPKFKPILISIACRSCTPLAIIVKDNLNIIYYRTSSKNSALLIIWHRLPND